MATEFKDSDLRVYLPLGEDWDEDFVDKHGKREKPHGQVKLLWSNLLALALVEEQMQKAEDSRSIRLVVAGASPGTHMLVLLEHIRGWRQARGVQIHLYDPLPLDAELQAIVDSDESMSFEPKPFTDQHAEKWQKSNEDFCVVFFSDIRSQIHSKWQHVHGDEVQIAADMQAQQTWVKIMQPEYCMLKFHAPHATKDKKKVQKSLRYLHGTLYEQAWVGLFSAEYRLFCTKKDMRRDQQYDTKQIERHAFYHTLITRPKKFSVQGEHSHQEMPYDEAFTAHVAHKAARWLKIDARKLLDDARSIGHVAHMHFTWPAAEMSRTQALHVRIQQIL